MRQGPDRRDHPSQFPAADVPLRQGRLHAVSQPTDRKRALRPREGRFTGAEQRRQGRFELAQGGTLYLDDADDIPLEHQAKLLRAIEEKVYERVGGDSLIRADVRIIASTKRNLLEKIAAGGFRQDLYYRLDVMRVNIPPLRERREDVPLLADHLLKRIAKDAAAQLNPEAQDVLQRHDWPGNVRELYHVLERAYLIGSGRICKELLLAELADVAHKRPAPRDRFTRRSARRSGNCWTGPCRPPAATSRPPPPPWE